MKTPHERYLESVKDADQVYYDAEIGMTKEEWQALIDNARSRFLIERRKDAQDARK